VGHPAVPQYTQLAPARLVIIIGKGVLSIERLPEVTQFSAGTGANGYADVYATWYNGNLYQNLSNTPAGWNEFKAAGTLEDYNAIDQGQVWIRNATGITLYGANGSPVVLNLDGINTPVSISGSWAALSGVGASGQFDCGVFMTAPNGELFWQAYRPMYNDPVVGGGGPGAGIYVYLGGNGEVGDAP
jgi:hypothetical protein